MHHVRWAFYATLLCAPHSLQAEADTSTLEVRLLRVEGAASGVRRSAERLSDIAKSISDSKRLSDLTQLNNELSELRIMVVGARMATDVAIKEMKGDLPAD